MDELVERLLAQKRTASDQRIVLDIAGECSDELATKLVESVRRYEELAMRRANRQHDLIWRQGMRSLISGSLLFATGIALSYLFTRPMVGEFAGDLFGTGVFLVVASAGLWYPLAVLFIAREQARREVRVLSTMLSKPVVRTRTDSAPIVTLPGLPRACTGDPGLFAVVAPGYDSRGKTSEDGFPRWPRSRARSGIRPARRLSRIGC
jgi:hypothetical protein